MEHKISVVIITLNEERIIECLSRLTFDEIVVVDSGSQDGTVAICENLGTSFYNKFEGYGSQKQFAVKTANNWVLSLDADEILNDELIPGNPKGFREQGQCDCLFYKRDNMFF
jgi:glycosyltransferase involved in cell wall biosynthesis